MIMAAMSSSTLLLMLIIVICADAKRVDGRPPRYRTLYACEGSSLEIVCEEGTHINLIRANFGRYSISVCNDNGNVEWSVDCMSHRSFRVMQERCLGRRQCLVNASVEIFGDECPSIDKYLEVHYQCLVGSELSHHLLNNELIASANVFGDPCPGTLKYLEAHYQCMPDYSQSSYSTPRSHHPIKNPLMPSFESNDKVHDNSNSSPNPRIIIPESYIPPPILSFPAIETDIKETENSETQTEITRKTIETNENSQPFDNYPRLNENDIPPPMNPPLISDNEQPIMTSENHNPINTYSDNNQNNANYYPSTHEPKWIRGESEVNEHIITDSSINKINNFQNQNNDKTIDLTVDHCHPNYSRGLFWNWTLTGHVANQSCPGGAKGLSRWSCSYLNGVPTWTPSMPDMSDCSSLWISHLESRINSGSESVVSLADELAKSCKEKILYGGDLFRATDIINQLVSRMEGALDESHDDQQRRSHVVKELLSSVQDVVSNLLDDNQLDSWHELSHNDQRAAISSMMHALERMALLLAETKSQSSDYMRAHHNIFVSVHVRSVSSLTDGLHLPPILEASEEMPVSVTSLSNSVHLPQQTLIEQSTTSGLVKVVFLMYKKLAKLLKPDMENIDHYPIMMTSSGGMTRLNITRIINSETIGILLNRERYTPLSEPFEFTLKHLITQNVSNPKCVFWDIERRDWSQQGCDTMSSNQTHTTCRCNHLTNFAILMDINNIDMSANNELVLRVITFTGCTVSIICLTFTFITLVSFRSLKSDRNTIHTNLCLCLVIAESIFLFGISQTQNKLICGLIAISLHYFFLASFLWMFFEGFQLYVMLIEVFEHEKSRINWYYLLSYGVPAILVIISAIIDPLSYGTSKYCWLRADNYFIWCFVGPVIAILLANLVFLSIAITTMCKHIPHISNKAKEQTKLTAVKVWIRGSLALVFLLGLTWTFGLLYLSRETLFMAYLFTITNSLQGLFIFIFNCLVNEKVRLEYRKLLSVINLTPICLETSPSKSSDTTRDQIPSSSLPSDQRTSLYLNNSNSSNAKDCSITTTTNNSIPNSQPLIGGNSVAQPNGLAIGSSNPITSESPTMRRSAHKYYLTDDSSDYGCKRLQQNRYQKQSCRDIYSLHGHHIMSSHPPSFIEHIYECIDEDPYVAKLLLPAIHRSLDGQHVRTLSDSSRHSDNRPLISSTSSPRNHNFHSQGSISGNHLPAIVRDNTANKTTIICSTQPTVALLSGDHVICCTLNDHQLCDHNLHNHHNHNQHSQQSIANQLRQQYLVSNSLNDLNCMPSKNSHLSSDC